MRKVRRPKYYRVNIFPPMFAFVKNKRQWDQEMKILKIEGEPYPDADGRCTVFDCSGQPRVIFVTIAERIDKKDDPVGTVGIVVHEAWHVWEAIAADIGGRSPSSELVAYALQYITSRLLVEYAESKRFKVKGP